MEQTKLAAAAETISLFCRLRTGTKQDLPIRASEMGLLMLLSGSEAPVTPVMAAAFFRVKKPMITAMMTSLLSKGYIEKMPSAEDRRSFVMRLTPAGEALVESAKGEYLKSLDGLCAKMGAEDFTTMVALLTRANQILLEEK